MKKTSSSQKRFSILIAAIIVIGLIVVLSELQIFGLTSVFSSITGNVIGFNSGESKESGFEIITIDSDRTVGEYPSLAQLDSEMLFVSYHDVTNKDLKFVKSLDSGKSWVNPVIIDSKNSIGPYSSIYAFDSQNLFIAYYDSTGNKLNLAKSTNGGITWELSTIDDDGDSGQYLSLYGSNENTLFVSYYEKELKNLKIAKSTDGGLTWELKIVDSSSSNVGIYTSINGVGSENIFVIYQDVQNADLKLAKTIDGGENWSLSIIDSVGNVGKFNSLDVYDLQNIYVSYYNSGTADLKFAKSSNSGITWELFEAITKGNIGKYSSLQTVSKDIILVSYLNETTKDLELIKTDNRGLSWTEPLTIDAAGNIGLFNSMKATPENNVFIAYFDNSLNDLKIAISTGENPIVDGSETFGKKCELSANPSKMTSSGISKIIITLENFEEVPSELNINCASAEVSIAVCEGTICIGQCSYSQLTTEKSYNITIAESEYECKSTTVTVSKSELSENPPNPNISVCSDGTEFGECSKTKPLICEYGSLIESCEICGCAKGTCVDNTCILGSNPVTEENSLNIETITNTGIGPLVIVIILVVLTAGIYFFAIKK